MTDRSDHIEGLRLSQMNPSDIDVFFRTLAGRVPYRTSDELAPVLSDLRGRIKQLVIDLGSADAVALDASLVDRHCELLVDQFAAMKRRHWKARIGDNRTIDYVRDAIGEISADLHALTVS